MKDTVISSAFKKRELTLILACLVAAVLFNMYSIIKFKTEWKELFTQFHVVLLVAVFFYIVLAILRILVSGIRYLVKKDKK